MRSKTPAHFSSEKLRSTVAASSFSAVDSSFANMLQGVILFTVLTADFLIRFRVVIARKGEPAHE